MAELEKEYSYRPLSVNEMKATLRNNIIYRFYLNDVKRFKQDHKMANFYISNKKHQIRKTINEIKNSTGYAFDKPDTYG
jgi:hypothetical protein